MRFLKELSRFAPAVTVALATFSASAWDYEAHRLINQVALASLSTNFPQFVFEPANAERIAFLAGEPDRWRNTPDAPLKHFNAPDHYIDLEELADYGLKLETLPVFRYEFTSHLALARKADPGKFPAPDPAKDQDKTQQLVGLLPWSLVENYGKAKSGFSYLKAYQENGGTTEEKANAQQNIIYVMGVMGHIAGDASQPLHTTMHHHGWVRANPNNYSTNSRIHSWIDGGYFAKVGLPKVHDLKPRLRPARLPMIGDRPAKPGEMFQVITAFLAEQHKLVEPLYQMEKAGKFSGNGTVGLEGRGFLEDQIIKSGQLLGDLWFAAWQQATPDTFLINQLNKRKTPP